MFQFAIFFFGMEGQSLGPAFWEIAYQALWFQVGIFRPESSAQYENKQRVSDFWKIQSPKTHDYFSRRKGSP